MQALDRDEPLETRGAAPPREIDGADAAVRELRDDLAIADTSRLGVLVHAREYTGVTCCGA